LVQESRGFRGLNEEKQTLFPYGPLLMSLIKIKGGILADEMGM
jgi:hypothetical protein